VSVICLCNSIPLNSSIKFLKEPEEVPEVRGGRKKKLSNVFCLCVFFKWGVILVIEWVAVTDAVFYFVWSCPHDTHCGAICEGIHSLCPALVAVGCEWFSRGEDFAGGARDPETAPVISVGAASRETVNGVTEGLSCHFANISVSILGEFF